MASSFRKTSLRSAVSGHDRATGEGLRDLESVIRGLVPFEVVAREGVVYAPPIVLTTQRMPQAVLIGRCRVSREPNSINVTAVNYTFDHGVVNINELVGLTVGTAYDITFLIFG